MSDEADAERPEESRGDSEPAQDENWRDPDEEYARLDPAYPDPGDQQMDEEEDDRPLLFYVFQAFLVPVIVIGFVLLMFIGLRWLFSAGQTADQLVKTIKRQQGRLRPGMIRGLISQLSGNRNLQTYQSDRELKRSVFQLLQNTRDDAIKRNLIVLMGVLKADRPRMKQELKEILTTTRNDRARIAVLKAMGDIADSSFSGPVQSYIRHKDPGLRQVAAYAAGQIRSQSFREPLRASLADPFAHVRLNAAMALSQYRNLDAKTAGEVLNVLRNMLDRKTLKGMRQPDRQGERKKLKRNDVTLMMVGAVQAIRALKRHDSLPLKRGNLLPKIKAISESGRSRHLRREARRTIEVLRSDSS